MHLKKIQEAANTFLGISVEIENFQPDESASSVKKKKVSSPTAGKKPQNHRPLMIKNHPGQSAPILLVMPVATSQEAGVPVLENKIGSVIKTSECDVSKAEKDPAGMDVLTMNSYQRAKIRCADKFKCDICGKGFPLSCLLQRHKRSHSDVKPFACNFCSRRFSSKTSVNHHLFMQHSEEQSQRLERGKKMIASLKQEQADKLRLKESEGIQESGTSVGAHSNRFATNASTCDNIQNMEILGVQDITHQIAVQTGKDDVNSSVVEAVVGCDNLFYIQSGQNGDYYCG